MKPRIPPSLLSINFKILGKKIATDFLFFSTPIRHLILTFLIQEPGSYFESGAGGEGGGGGGGWLVTQSGVGGGGLKTLFLSNTI